jgi:ATP-dependent DNA helicase RecQ
VAEARKFLKNDYLDFTPRKQIPDKALRVYNFGRSFPAYLQPEKGFILSRWNDSGWGTMVADDKHTGYFRDELVDAITGLLRANSDICSSLQWVTCVPSHNHPRLVPDFAERVALKLQIPFIDAIKKDRNNEMQKLQENSFYQCSNLDGVFSIEKGIPSGGVLLIDDIVDSRWTMTILSALLRQNGSGPVYPAALSSTGFGE